MKPIPPSPYVSVFMLLKQSATTLTPIGLYTGPNMGAGIYPTLQAAEQQRLVEVLASSSPASKFLIFELEIPNPAYESTQSQDNS